eukprot:COSAG01_NODE_41236_length_454_cov_0.667606_1_plen_151_part_11
MAEFAGRLPGLHLEGPFLSQEDGAKGAHRAECMGPPSIDYFERLLALARGRISIMTIAAELPGAAEFIRHAVSRGVTISIGHSLASGDELSTAAAAGARHMHRRGLAIAGGEQGRAAWHRRHRPRRARDGQRDGDQRVGRRVVSHRRRRRR